MRSCARCSRAASRRAFQLARYITHACTAHAPGGQANTGSTRRKWPRTEYVPGGCRVTWTSGGQTRFRLHSLPQHPDLRTHCAVQRRGRAPQLAEVNFSSSSETGDSWHCNVGRPHPCSEREEDDEDGAGIPQDEGAQSGSPSLAFHLLRLQCPRDAESDSVSMRTLYIMSIGGVPKVQLHASMAAMRSQCGTLSLMM